MKLSKNAGEQKYLLRYEVLLKGRRLLTDYVFAAMMITILQKAENPLILRSQRLNGLLV